jgi:hypothetical protein
LHEVEDEKKNYRWEEIQEKKGQDDTQSNYLCETVCYSTCGMF